MPSGSGAGEFAGRVQRWTVLVDDNFHFRDESERYELGSYNCLNDAMAACRAVVDRFLQGRTEPDAASLLECYLTFGENPFIVGPEAGVKFSAREYARLRCDELRLSIPNRR